MGDYGASIRYDGVTWEILPTPAIGHLVDLWARGPSAVFAVTERGVVIRFNGEEWVEHSTVPGELALDLWGDANGVAGWFPPPPPNPYSPAVNHGAALPILQTGLLFGCLLQFVVSKNGNLDAPVQLTTRVRVV